MKKLIKYYQTRDFFGTSSPYADLLDYLNDPPPLYDLPEGKGIPTKQPPIHHALCLTLHEIFFGGVKKMKIHHLVYVREEKTTTEVREKILSVPIKPGVRPGTEIVFPEEGDENPLHISGITSNNFRLKTIRILLTASISFYVFSS